MGLYGHFKFLKYISYNTTIVILLFANFVNIQDTTHKKKYFK